MASPPPPGYEVVTVVKGFNVDTFKMEEGAMWVRFFTTTNMMIDAEVHYKFDVEGFSALVNHMRGLENSFKCYSLLYNARKKQEEKKP